MEASLLTYISHFTSTLAFMVNLAYVEQVVERLLTLSRTVRFSARVVSVANLSCGSLVLSFIRVCTSSALPVCL